MPRKRTFYQRWIEDWWLTEITAMLVSCLLIVALCLVLRHYDGRRVPNLRIEGFGHSNNITLGTIVSLLITLSVAASLAAVQSSISQLKWQWYSSNGKRAKSRPLRDLDILDSASRGFTGSVMMLWKLRLSPVAASFGALLVIIHLAIAPITQQSVQQVSKRVSFETGNTLDKATIATTQIWRGTGQQSNVKGMPPGYAHVTPGMRGAIPNGLFANTTISLDYTAPTCSSGNCTFPDYQSLGICSSVANVTASGKRTILPNEDKYCILDKFCVTNGDTNGLGNITSAASSSQIYAKEPNTPLNFSSVAFAHGNNAATIADFYILYLDKNKNVTNGNVYAAVEFTLTWCVPTFSTKVDNSTAITTQHPDPNTNFSHKGVFITTTVDGTSFNVDPPSHYSLQRYLWVLLSGSVWADAENSIWVDSAEVGVLASQFDITGDNEVLQNGTQAEFIDRLAKVMDNVAISMTNYIRSTGGQSATGTIYIQQNFVRVAWGLIAAPVAFTALCLFFLLSVVFSGSFHSEKKQKPPLWRSALTAGLRCLDPQLHRALGGMMAPDVMNEASQELYVQLSKEGDGWWLLADVDAQGTEKGLPMLSNVQTEDSAPNESGT